jgi:hypothetical protein
VNAVQAFALGYIAGIIDGEGHISKDGSGEVEVTELDIAEAFLEALSAVGIHTRIRHSVRTFDDGHSINRYRVRIPLKQVAKVALFLQSGRKKERVLGKCRP